VKEENLPSVALSVRQPWAWLIVNGHKDVENRTWCTRFRGPVLIHAAKGMTRDEYDNADVAAAMNGVEIPPFAALERGGIVGVVEIVDCVSRSSSDWFYGPFGFVLKNARWLLFRPCKGSLGFFHMEGSAAS